MRLIIAANPASANFRLRIINGQAILNKSASATWIALREIWPVSIHASD